MRIRTSDGHMHPAICTSRHPVTGHGKLVVVLTDLNRVIDLTEWVFCQVVTATEQERTSMRTGGYRC